MTTSASTELYYDPYDFDIDTDPYPTWKRLRDEAPLYYNERHDFYALSRFEDVRRCLADWKTYISGKGSVLELIKSGMEIPPGSILFEDPPAHDEHRSLLSRVFTPRAMNAIEPEVRRFCGRTLDPLVGTGHFDFIHDLGRRDAHAGHRHAARDPRGGSGRDPGPPRPVLAPGGGDRTHPAGGPRVRRR